MTISRKLVLTLLTVALTPLLVALFSVNKLVVQQTESLVGVRLQDNVEQTARAIDQFMLDSSRSMRAFVDDTAERSQGYPALSARLRKLTYSYPTFSELNFVGKSGRVLASSNPDSIGKDIVQTNQGLADEFDAAKNDKYDQVYVSDTHDLSIDNNSNFGDDASSLPIQMVVAVHDSKGVMRGVLVGHVVIGAIRDLIVELNHRTPGGQSATLFDDLDHVLVSSDPDQTFGASIVAKNEPLHAALKYGKTGWLKRVNRTGDLVMTGYTPLWEYGANNAGGWRLTTNASYATIMAPVKVTIARLLTSFGLLLIGAAVLGLLIARNLSQPLLKLADAARSFSKGDYSVRVKIKSSDETGLLGQTFNVMAETVETDRQNVRNEMAERQRAALELERAKEEAEKANMAKSEFLSHMSHELRTPLNAVLGFAQLLQLQSEDPDTLESAQSILKGGRHLLQLVNEVLDLSRIESGKLTLSVEPVELKDAVRQAVDLALPLAEEKGVSITVNGEIDDTAFVTADRQRLVQALLNILANACKYNRPDGHVEIRCFEGTDGMRRIEVSDTGKGIKASGRHLLFQPFERLGEDSTDGTGLGLALSRRLVRLMGGELSLVSTGESGSTFAFDLKPSEAPTAFQLEEPCFVDEARSDNGQRLKIVYIDDSRSNLELMERVFEGTGGVELLPAMEASVGVRLVQEQAPDLVLLDLHLPDLSGLEVVKQLQSDPLTAHIPIVVISADATDNQIKGLLAAGVRTYLTKPLDLNELFPVLDGIKEDRRTA